MATQLDTVTVFVKTSGAAKYQADLIDSPSRLVLDFEDTTYGWRKTPLAVSSAPLRQIRGSQFRKGVARVVVELTRPVGYAIREDDDGLTIVIPTSTAAVASTAPAPAPRVETGTPAPVTARPAAPRAAAPPAPPPPPPHHP
ncbi:MAG: AMIN domain-containing protein, partial [Candidatus Rokuibacteriota bacterium]